MLEKNFADVYTKFKLQFYKKIFKRFEAREASLTAIETFCLEVIYALDKPTINEFATFTEISPPNAAYVRKGYLRKVQSKTDKREYYLEVTDRFFSYYDVSYSYIGKVMKRIRERFPDEDIKKMDYILSVISSELMPEVSNMDHKNMN
ncbi:MAG: MarR family winged helix-turn-helix transcriptional regulator [Oscillospiraceae bacterium]